MFGISFGPLTKTRNASPHVHVLTGCPNQAESHSVALRQQLASKRFTIHVFPNGTGRSKPP